LKSSIHGVVGTNSVGAISRLAPVTVALAVHRVQSWAHWGREPAPHWDSGNGEPVVTSNLSTLLDVVANGTGIFAGSIH
jgi:hypothetical protein